MEYSAYPYSFAEIQKQVCRRLQELGHPERIPNWGMMDGGAESGSTWRRNYESYESIGFRQRLIHQDVSPSLPAVMGGRKVSMPVAAAPMAVAINLVNADAFVEIARACGRFGIAAGLGFPSGEIRGRDMVKACPNCFRIVKPHRNERVLIEELQRAEADGCFAAGVDVDSICGLKTGDDAGHFGEITKPYSMEMLRAARQSIKIPFWVKGIMSASDAEAAKEVGADAIIVSTHAGYSLDCGYSPLEVLGEIRSAVGSGMEVYVDSGIRRGTDVLKAMALGADGVLLGRLMIWGLLLGGSSGVEWILHLLQEEMLRAMQLMGAGDWKSLDRSCLVPLNALGQKILSEPAH